MAKRANETGPITDVNAILTQREELKKQDPEAILLFRDGNHYRAFHECAREMYSIDWRDPEDVWFKGGASGFQCHFGAIDLERILDRIVKAGKRAAVCEQVENPIPVVGRKEVKRIVTPGPAASPASPASPTSPATAGHQITLGYTMDDDGIWLECSCGYLECLGYHPTIATVVKAARSHSES